MRDDTQIILAPGDFVVECVPLPGIERPPGVEEGQKFHVFDDQAQVQVRARARCIIPFQTIPQAKWPAFMIDIGPVAGEVLATIKERVKAKMTEIGLGAMAEGIHVTKAPASDGVDQKVDV